MYDLLVHAFSTKNRPVLIVTSLSDAPLLLQSHTHPNPPQVASNARVARRHHATTIYAAKRAANPTDPLRSGRGYINKDNSGRSNIFGTVPDKLYVSSPTSDRVARSGIGGLQGLTVLGVAVVALLVVTTGVLRFEDGDDLKSVGAPCAVMSCCVLEMM